MPKHICLYRCGMLTALAIACPASADAAPMIIAGGALDPAYTDADIYIDMPPPPEVPAGPACKMAKAYVDYHQAGRYAEVPSLFAPGAVFLEPSRGSADLTQFYGDVIARAKPRIAAVFYLGDAVNCIVELAVGQQIDGKLRYRLASMDHFTVDGSGRISRMVAFQRPSKYGLKLQDRGR